MPLPEQVRKQVEAADHAIAELSKPGEGGTPTDQPPVAEKPVAPPVSGEVVPFSAKPKGSEEAPWEERFKALQGLFDAKMPQLQGELKNAQLLSDQQRQMIMALQGQIQQLQQNVQPSRAAAPPASVLTEEELKDYTPEFFSMMQRWLEPQLGPIRHAIVELQRNVPQAVQQLSSQVQTVAHTQALTQEDKFFQAVDAAVPNWKQLNTDQGFLQWLGVVDSMTGISRHAYLSDARANLDAGRAIAIFQAYVQETGGSVTPTGTSAAQVQSHSELERQVTVESTKRSSAPSSGQETRTFSQKDLDKLYADYRRGLYKGKEAEFQVKERELLEAINSGRYVKR